jgi:hypothetical protein
MKPSMNLNRIKGITVLVLCTMTFSLFSQALPEIGIRFANPGYEHTSRSYTVDVEVISKEAAEKLFGMNFRFYYDASMLTFEAIDQIYAGYGILGDVPEASVGNELSGKTLFSFQKAAGYMNTAIILYNEQNPMDIITEKWVKLCRISFKVPVTTLNKEKFCPSLIWDLEEDQGNGGFLAGAGLVITLIERDRSSRYQTTPARAVPEQFNWQYDEAPGYPFGRTVTQECIPVGTITATEEQDKTHAGYALFQNTPNPFEGQTTIDFILPSAQEATIVFYDVEGVVKETIEGSYEAGRNQVQLKKKQWMVESGVIYYRLISKKYTSPTLSMTLVRA